MQLWANAEWCIHLEKQFFGLETGQSHHRQHQLKVGNALLAFLKTTTNVPITGGGNLNQVRKKCYLWDKVAGARLDIQLVLSEVGNN